MNDWLERTFELSARGTDLRTEAVAGATTFATMAYILFVQPVVLSAAGIDPGAALVATAISSALACVAMAFLANYPIALAPAMGHNFFFTYEVVLGGNVPWPVALGLVGVSGALFVALAATPLRETLIEAIPTSLKRSIAAGIGLLITLIGLQWSGLVVDHPATLVTLGDLTAPHVLLALFGLATTSILYVRGFRGAVLVGILATTVLSLLLGFTRFEGVVAAPPSLAPTLLALDPLAAFSLAYLPFLFVFFFLDLFDTVGTLVGVSERAGLLDEDGRLPNAKGALLSDAIGTVAGASLGTSTVTSYVESASGVSAGGRTGLANLVTAALFLGALLFTPVVQMVSGAIEVDGAFYYPTIAPALIVVGFFMIQSAAGVEWTDPTEGIPAFLAMVVMPLSFSITEGIALGFISYSVLKAGVGRAGDVHPFVHVCSVLFVLRYAFLGA